MAMTENIVVAEMTWTEVDEALEKRPVAILPAGTISGPPETAIALLRDVCISASKKFRAVALANIHLEPKHIECLKAAMEQANKAGASVCWADITKQRWGENL